MISRLRAIYELDKEKAFAFIINALNKHEGDVTAAATDLKVSKNTLFRWIKAHPKLSTSLEAIRSANGWIKIGDRYYPPTSSPPPAG